MIIHRISLDRLSRLCVRGVSGSIIHKDYVLQFFTLAGMEVQACAFCVRDGEAWKGLMISSYVTRCTRVVFLPRLSVRMVKSGGLLFILLLFPGLSCPSIISRDQSRETVTSEALTDGVVVSGAIDETAWHVFPNAGSGSSAAPRITEKKQPDENELSLPRQSATRSAGRDIPSFYLLVIVMIFALFIELTGNRFR